MKKILIVLAVLGFALTASANSSFFVPSTYLTSTTSTSTIASVSSGVDKSFIIDSYASTNTKIDYGYLLTELNASTTASTTIGGVKIGIKILFSQNGIDYFTNNIATSTTVNPIILGDNPQYTFSANLTSSSTLLSAIRVETPLRYTKITYSALTNASTTVATSSVWAQFVPIKQL